VETFCAELARQLARVYGHPPAATAAIVAVVRTTARDRGFVWVDLDGPAVRATCAALGIGRVTARNLEAFTFNHE
jgi:hypothetical protein